MKGSLEEESITKTWHSLIRQHNKLWFALIKKESVKDQLKAEKLFRRDPHKFTAKLFNKTQKCGEPAFTAESAQQYFEKTYRDEKRNHICVPLPEFERPLLPEHIFFTSMPN